MNKIISILCCSALFVSTAAFATPASDALLASYKAAGAGKADAAKGKADWVKETKGEEGQTMSCSTCHGTDLSKSGEHYKTHKTIKPMAASANAERFTDEKKIEKWFKRNCKDVLGRECSAQEKTDFLTFLLAQ